MSGPSALPTVLADAGVRRGDRVALLLHNGLEFPESLLACHVLGAIPVPVNFRLAPDEIAYILRDAGAVALIADEGSPSLGVDGLLLTAGPAYEDAIASADPHPEPAWLREEDPALMCYTSGTTGRPKGAVLTHGNLVASTLSWIHEMRAGRGRRLALRAAAVPHRRDQRAAAVPDARSDERRDADDRLRPRVGARARSSAMA